MSESMDSKMNSTAEFSTQLLEAVTRGSLDEILLLLNKGADPNYRDPLDGSTCLHRLAEEGDLTAIELLLDRRADLNVETQNTSTSPLGIASLAGRTLVAKFLLARGARLTAYENSSGLIEKCRSSNLDEIATILELATSAGQ